MKRYRLLRASVVLPDHPTGWPKILGLGTVVELLPTIPSPVTGKPDELYVQYADATKTLHQGWLAKHTPMDTKHLGFYIDYVPPGNDDGHSTWDELRRRMYYPRRFKTPMAKYWLYAQGKKYLPELRRVIREFGGRQAPDDEAPQLIRQMIWLLFHERLQRIPTMNVSHQNPKKATNVKGALKKAKEAKKSKKHAGDEVIIVPSSGGKKSKKDKKAAKQAKKDKSSKKGGAGTKRPSFKGMRLVPIMKANNAHNPNTQGSRSFDIIFKKGKKGIMYEDFISKGGRRTDVVFELKHKMVKLVDAE